MEARTRTRSNQKQWSRANNNRKRTTILIRWRTNSARLKTHQCILKSKQARRIARRSKYRANGLLRTVSETTMSIRRKTHFSAFWESIEMNAPTQVSIHNKKSSHLHAQLLSMQDTWRLWTYYEAHWGWAKIGVLANTFAIKRFSIMSVLFDHCRKSKHLHRQVA